MALIGESRVAEILANVLFPFWLSQDAECFVAGHTRKAASAAYRIDDSKPPPRDSLATIRAGSNF